MALPFIEKSFFLFPIQVLSFIWSFLFLQHLEDKCGMEGKNGGFGISNLSDLSFHDSWLNLVLEILIRNSFLDPHSKQKNIFNFELTAQN